MQTTNAVKQEKTLEDQNARETVRRKYYITKQTKTLWFWFTLHACSTTNCV